MEQLKVRGKRKESRGEGPPDEGWSTLPKAAFRTRREKPMKASSRMTSLSL